MAYTVSSMIGTADWHWLRKFSLTSSQAHGAFIKGIQSFKDDPAWIHVARYLYGADWQTELGITAAADAASEEDSESDSDSDEDRSDPLAPLPVADTCAHIPEKSEIISPHHICHPHCYDNEELTKCCVVAEIIAKEKKSYRQREQISSCSCSHSHSCSACTSISSHRQSPVCTTMRNLINVEGPNIMMTIVIIIIIAIFGTSIHMHHTCTCSRDHDALFSSIHTNSNFAQIQAYGGVNDSNSIHFKNR